MLFFRADDDAGVIYISIFVERVPAGFPIPAQDYIENRIDLNLGLRGY